MTAESFKPQFTTSASAQEENKEKREKAGVYFGDRVKTVTTPPPEPPQGASDPLRPISSPPEVKPLTERQKALLHKANNKDVRDRNAGTA